MGNWSKPPHMCGHVKTHKHSANGIQRYRRSKRLYNECTHTRTSSMLSPLVWRNGKRNNPSRTLRQHSQVSKVPSTNRTNWDGTNFWKVFLSWGGGTCRTFTTTPLNPDVLAFDGPQLSSGNSRMLPGTNGSTEMGSYTKTTTLLQVTKSQPSNCKYDRNSKPGKDHSRPLTLTCSKEQLTVSSNNPSSIKGNG